MNPDILLWLLAIMATIFIGFIGAGIKLFMGIESLINKTLDALSDMRDMIETRDSSYMETLKEYRRTLSEFQRHEDESHKEIVKMIGDHDRHAHEANLKIAQILKELERGS